MSLMGIFWNPDSHVIVAWTDHVKIEMTIGSNVAKVNGKEMRLDTAPYLLDGRTIVDANLYQAACTLIGRQDLISSAE